jgi:hypothetical protein
VGGVVLAAIGLWYDDFHGGSPVTQDLIDVLTYNTGVNSNDVAYKSSFPYVASPWAGTHNCPCGNNQTTTTKSLISTEQVAGKTDRRTGIIISRNQSESCSESQQH